MENRDQGPQPAPEHSGHQAGRVVRILRSIFPIFARQAEVDRIVPNHRLPIVPPELAPPTDIKEAIERIDGAQVVYRAEDILKDAARPQDPDNPEPHS